MGAAIDVSNLSFNHIRVSTPALVNISFSLPAGTRTIIVGANGAGKSTLLQVLAGKRLITAPGAQVKVLGKDVFRGYPAGVTYLGTEW
jgi:CCR4-NOT complex subunit CAF16